MDRQVEGGGQLAALQQQLTPGDRPLLNVGGHHGAEGPALVVGALDGRVEQDPPPGVAEAQTKLDVLDARAVVGRRIEPPQGQEGLTSHSAAAGPEGDGGAGVAGVGVVMQQVAEAAHHPIRRGPIVVAAEKRRQLRFGGETDSDAFDGVGVEFHIGIHEDEDLTTGCSGCQVAGGGGA